jgi:CHC2 zinc finger
MVVFSEDELHQARTTPVLEIAKEHGAKLRRSGKQYEGPCPVCGGDNRFWVVPSLNVAGCRICDFRGDAIALEMHLSGSSFVDAVRALIGQDAGTPTRRQPTAEEIAARLAREAEQKRAEAEDQARKEMSAARIIACLQPVAGTPGETYLRNVRRIDVSHWAVKRALEDVATLGWYERVYFNQPDPKEPFHELNGQWLGAIIAIQTDPVTAERTGGITRTYIHQGRKIGKAKSLAGVGQMGIVRLSPDDEVLGGLHICEGIESALSGMSDPRMNFCPMWAAGSRVQLAGFPVLTGIEFLTVIADNDEPGIKDASAVCQRWGPTPAAGR